MKNRVSISVASARGVADRWREQYYERDGRKWSSTVSGPAEKVYDQLCALGQNPDIDIVAKIIGNESWSHLLCSGCNERVKAAVSFGSNYSDNELLLCAPCVEDAARALGAGPKT